MDLVEFYKLSTDSLILMNSYGSLSNQAQLEDYDDLKYSYLSVTSGPDKFYCLKSCNGSDEGSELETYDISSLSPISIYNIDKPIKSIIYDKNNKKLVGYSAQEEKTVFYFWEI